MDQTQTQLNPDAFKSLLLKVHPDATASDGRKYADIPALELTQKAVANHPDGVTNAGIKYSDYLGQTSTQNQPTLTGSDNLVGSLPVIKQLTQFGAGIGSAVGKAALNIPKAILSGAQGIANAGTKIMGTPQQDYSGTIKGIDNVSNKLFQEPVQNELNSGFGAAGNIVGQAAPYIATSGAISGLSNAATGAIEGAGILPAIGRTLAGAATEGLANAGTGYALSGGDTKQALTQGATAGLLKGGFSTLGEVANGTKLPQRLLGSIYKTDKNAVAKIFNEVGTSAEGTTTPLSKWALDKGLKGTLEGMAVKVKSILKQSEDKVIASAEASNKRIPVAPNMLKMAQKIQADFEDVGRGEIAQKASQFLQAIKDDSVSVKDAIKFRRLIDNTLRTKSSFNNPTLADNLSYWAEDLRKSINSADGIGGINKDYSQAIKARDALIKAATAANNHKALGALESYALGGGLIAGEPITGVGTVMAKRALQSPRVVTNIAQTLKNLPQSSAAGSATRSVLGSQLGALNQSAGKQ